jgi:membrane-associated phospholipid phosphatase
MSPAFHSFWHTVTRLGEAQILLPALAVMLVWFALRPQGRPVVRVWLVCIGVAALLTTATKVAFIGWEVGYAPLDFTGISGHSMFAAAVLPVLAGATASGASPRTRLLALAASYGFAALIAVSRVMTGAHSVSEAIAGFAIGAVASQLALRLATAPRTQAPKALLAGLLVWLVLTPAGAPPSRTHDWVTRLSITLSGREQPYTRWMMLRRYRLEQLQRLQPGFSQS